MAAVVILIASLIQENSKNGLTIREKLDRRPFILRFAALFVLLISIVVLMLITYIDPLTTFLPTLLN